MENIKTRPWFGPTTKRLAIPLGVITVIATLIYFEQIALLYVLSTLVLIALLLAVAFADLESFGVSDDAGTRPENLPE